MTPEEQKLFDIQGNSTKRLMMAQAARKIEDDYLYHSYIKSTPIAKEAQCVKEDGTVDLNVRATTQEEADLYQRHRYDRGGYIKKEVYTPTLTEEKRERGAAAFMRAISVDALKHKFKNIMKDLFKPTHAEIMAESIRKVKE